MISADLHTHTLYSHGKDTPEAMWASAQNRGLQLFGFTEHSPRPHNYNYTNEYRDHLVRYFPQYVAEVKALQQRFPGQVLLGMEMDWMEKEVDFIKQSITAYDFDYLIGSVHFLQTWGYDDDPADWKSLAAADHEKQYQAYFATLRRMAESRLFHIAAHMDLIKIFSIDAFRTWIARPQARSWVHDALVALKEADMALEISSAGLRKPCQEIYPGPQIMQWAADMQLDITLASDAHNVQDVAYAFDHLEAYARQYGYRHSVWFCQGKKYAREF